MIFSRMLLCSGTPVRLRRQAPGTADALLLCRGRPALVARERAGHSGAVATRGSKLNKVTAGTNVRIWSCQAVSPMMSGWRQSSGNGVASGDRMLGFVGLDRTITAEP
jgi:hypothetical protein